MKRLKYIFLLAFFSSAICGYAQTPATDTTTNGRAYIGDDQAPLGVITDRVHSKGQWMAAYTYTDMMMKGNRIGTTKVGNDYINQYYRIAPDKMSSQTHMATLMYGVSDRFTLMAAGGYMLNNMTMTAASIYPLVENSTLVSKSSGFADTKISAMYNFINKKNNDLTATFGINLPTGTITAMGQNISGNSRRLPYLMQTGTGTYGLLPSVTYIKTQGAFSFGAAGSADINIGTNPQGYSFGNIYSATAWASYRIFSFLSASLRAEYISTGKMSGSDNYIDYYLNNDPTSDNNNSGGKRMNMYAGLNFSAIKVKGLHLLIEYGMPVYENLEGMQMSSHAMLGTGIQYTF